MPLFRTVDGRLRLLRALAMQSEKAVQTLVESNLQELLDMHFLATEFRTADGTGRIDTLAVDYSGAPVIIEYKKTRDDNVITQALSYLYWLKTQDSSFFERLVEKKLGREHAKALPIDWKNPRVLCIAAQFSRNDINTVKVIQGVRIELLRYLNYDGGLFSLEPETPKETKICLPRTTAESEAGRDEVTAETLLAKTSEGTRQLFLDLHDRIMALDENVSERTTKSYLAYRITKNFAELHIQKKQLMLYLRPLNYEDPRGGVEQVPDSFGWVMNRRVYLRAPEDIDYVMELVEKSYQDVL